VTSSRLTVNLRVSLSGYCTKTVIDAGFGAKANEILQVAQFLFQQFPLTCTNSMDPGYSSVVLRSSIKSSNQ
jgi:hypothetical protein